MAAALCMLMCTATPYLGDDVLPEAIPLGARIAQKVQLLQVYIVLQTGDGGQCRFADEVHGHV